MNTTQYILSENQMRDFARHLALRVREFPNGGQVLFLKGDVGVGKTTFTRFFSEFLGAESATSPTFSLLEKREIRGIHTPKNTKKGNKISEKMTLFHGDFYRGDADRIYDIMDEYQEMQEISEKKNPNHRHIWILEWFPEYMQKEFFAEVPKIFLDFSHGENRENREISLRFKNPFAVLDNDVSRLLKKYKTPVHIQNHIEMVSRVAMTVGKKLQNNGIPLDLELIKNAALLHDAVKYVDFPEFSEQERFRYTEEITPEKLRIWKKIKQKFLKTDHGKAMAEILTTSPEYFPATAQLIMSHMTYRIFSDKPMIWEEKVLYYADKRSLHDTFVTIQERLEDGRKRYGYEASSELNTRVEELEKSLEQAGKFLGKDLEISD